MHEMRFPEYFSLFNKILIFVIPVSVFCMDFFPLKNNGVKKLVKNLRSLQLDISSLAQCQWKQSLGKILYSDL